MNYTVSRSGDLQVHVLQVSLQLIYKTTRSYTITNLTTMTTYTFSVVATNAVGSGEDKGVVFTITLAIIITTTVLAT